MRYLRTAIAALLVSSLSLPATAIEGYYQHPTVAKNRIAFTAEGDVWLASLAGGDARRLTTHAEIETRPELSSDGEWVAFIASYDDSSELYVVPSSGGAPTRLTFFERVSDIAGWTNDNRILYVTGELGGPLSQTLIREIDPGTREQDDWPLLNANQAAVADRGRKYFTRQGLHRTGDHARMYRGGAMAELWQFDRRADEAEQLLPEVDANLKNPMWADGRLYFLSDQSGRFNLWSINRDGADLAQHTDFEDWDVRNPDLDGDTIVFQLGADLHRYSVVSGETAMIDISLLTDLGHQREKWVKKATSYVGDVTLAPGGERVAVSARGQLLLAGTRQSRRITIPVGTEARARSAMIGTSGDWLYAIVGEATSEHIVRFATDGSDTSEVLTSEPAVRRWNFSVSPDELKLAHADHRGNLWLTPVGGRRTLVDREPSGDDVYSTTWSSDSRWLAYTKTMPSGAQVFLHDTESGTTTPLTSQRFPSFSPAFSLDDKWLYFLSNRNFEPTPSSPWGDRNMGPMFDRRTLLYAIDLTGSDSFAFLPEELRMSTDTDDSEKEEEDDSEAAPARIDLENIAQRLYEIPVAAGNYSTLRVGEKHLFVLDDPVHSDERSLKSISISGEADVETFADKVSDFDVAANGKKLMYRSGDNVYIVDAVAKAPDKLKDAAVNLQGWALAIETDAEWTQIFDDAWRMHRDFSFDREMRGVDWEAMRDKYRPLVSRITHRSELNDLLGEMAGELGILHSQVYGGDVPEDTGKPTTGALGGDYEATQGGVRITRIFKGDPDLPDERVPLAQPYADIREGDTIAAVNRQPVGSKADLARALRNEAGQVIELAIVRDREETRYVLIKPMPASRMARIRYRDWEQRNREFVLEASDGKVGYLHLYAMGRGDIADFAREYFAETHRDAIIIDARSNRGGNIDSWIINELSKQAWAFWSSAESSNAHGNTNIQRAFRGHLAVLIDERTYSDGETFAAGIKALGLAPLIGERTAGAGIWLTGRNRLADNGMARIAEFGQFSLDGSWLVEGTGVTPDIQVSNPPHEAYEGTDRQLEYAIAHLKERIAADPVPELEAKPIPPVGESAPSF